MFIGGVAVGLGIAGIAGYLLYARVMKVVRGAQPLPGDMDAKLTHFGIDMLREMLSRPQ